MLAARKLVLATGQDGTGEWWMPDFVRALPPDRRAHTCEAIDFERLRGRTVAVLGTGASAKEALTVAGWPDESGAVVIIGHQPTLGRIAALLLGGQEADWAIKKGGVWWFSSRVRNDGTQAVLRAVLNPDFA